MLNKLNENRILNIILNTVLVLLFSYCFYQVGYVCITSLSGQMNTKVELENTLSHIFYPHSVLIVLPLLLLSYSIAKRNINKIFIFIIVVSAFIIPFYEWMDNYLHPFLFNTGIYNFLLRKNQTILNPQYTKIILYIILLSVLGIMVIYKKTRTLDRLMIFFMGSSVLLTLILFHTAVPSGFFVLAKNQAVQETLNQFNTLSTKDICKNNNCFILDRDNQSTSLTGKDYSKYKTYDWFILNAKKYMENNSSQNIAIQAVGDFTNQRFDYNIMAIKKVQINDQEKFLVFVDENKMKPYSRQSEIWFSFLTTAAHSIWIFGSLLLIFFHKNKFRKRLITV